MLYISNIYGAEIFGRYSISLALWQLLILVFSFGLPLTMVKLTADTRFYNHGRPINSYLQKSAFLLLFSAFFCTLIIQLTKEWLAIQVFNDFELIKYFEYLSYCIGFGIFHLFFVEFIRGKQLFKKYALFYYVLPYVITIPLLFVFNNLGLPESNTIFAYVLSISVLAIILFLNVPLKKTKELKNYPQKDLLNLSLPLLFSALFIFLSNWTDVFMLGAMATKSEVGVYNVAYKLAAISLIVINAVNTVIAPRISELYSNNQISQISDEVKKATRLIALVTLPVVLVLIIFSKQFLNFFGEDFISGQRVLLVLSIGFLFNALSGSVGQVLSMTQHQKQLRNFTIVSTIFNVILNYILINSHGVLGAALASVLSNILLNAMCIYYIKKKFDFYAFIFFHK
ncbi:flippase [Muricauda sp. CAU 1633]|nr:flippase [Muricauda sp. CAU 1633]